jgi:hypothetical protein
MILGVSLCGPLVSDRPQARRGVEIANELFHAPASGRCGGETVAHRGDRCWCVMTRPFKGLRSGNLVFSGCQLFCSCRMRRRTENVFHLMSACLGMKVRSAGRMACGSCRVDRSW